MMLETPALRRRRAMHGLSAAAIVAIIGGALVIMRLWRQLLAMAILVVIVMTLLGVVSLISLVTHHT